MLTDYEHVNWRLVTHVTVISEDKTQPYPLTIYRCHLVGGGTVDIRLGRSPGDFLRPEAVVPAHPGYSVLSEVDHWAEYRSSPVIAWRCLKEDWPDPVCIDELPQHYAIQHPSGIVVEPGLMTHANADEWLREGKLRAEERAGRLGVLR